MIAVAVDAAARKAGAAPDPQAILQQLIFHAEPAEALRHGGEAIAFLHAQLVSPADERLPFRAGRRDEEHRQLVDAGRDQ